MSLRLAFQRRQRPLQAGIPKIHIIDQKAIADIRARIEELTAEISASELYRAFAAAQQEMNALMAEVNAEIKYCITGERPSDCTHDCSTCKGCH